MLTQHHRVALLPIVDLNLIKWSNYVFSSIKMTEILSFVTTVHVPLIQCSIFGHLMISWGDFKFMDSPQCLTTMWHGTPASDTEGCIFFHSEMKASSSFRVVMEFFRLKLDTRVWRHRHRTIWMSSPSDLVRSSVIPHSWLKYKAALILFTR